MMRFAILPFEPESFVFPRVARFSPDTYTVEDDLEPDLAADLPAFTVSDDLFETPHSENHFDSRYVFWFALLLVCLAEDEDNTGATKTRHPVQKDSELFDSANELRSLIDVATKKFNRWSAQPFVSSEKLFVCGDEHRVKQSDFSNFRTQMLITHNYLMRKDARTLTDMLRRYQSPSTYYRATANEMRTVVKSLMRASWTRYSAFLRQYSRRVTELQKPELHDIDSFVLVRCEVDALLREVLSANYRNETFRCLSRVPGMTRDLLRCLPTWSKMHKMIRVDKVSAITPRMKTVLIKEMNATVKRHAVKKFKELVTLMRHTCVTEEVALLTCMYFCKSLLEQH
ncbi:hypothetical protein CYMTET_49928 [Cymbomonas tetramitiformis]|uniref:Uncharacterized protein n=1 Tax=Cymbomonas tetramitiformis TaxID=36881 RepID=A0AAE0BQG0_9CHLO|nr:hypothetical protein CYMTET_49928 [Cymbomonas tetramitiformis]